MVLREYDPIAWRRSAMSSALGRRRSSCSGRHHRRLSARSRASRRSGSVPTSWSGWMRERRCFVQFIRPGGEHAPDQGDLKFWNRDQHRRKFLRSGGRYVDGGETKEGEVVFWGEWEPESRVVARYADR